MDETVVAQIYLEDRERKEYFWRQMLLFPNTRAPLKETNSQTQSQRSQKDENTPFPPEELSRDSGDNSALRNQEQPKETMASWAYDLLPCPK